MTVSSATKVLAFLLLASLAAPPASAQIEDQLSSYTGKNATGYMQPFADAFGSSLNAAVFKSASIPKMKPIVRLELQIMAVFFPDDDRTFRAITESGFSPEQRVSAPTVIGDGKAVTIDGDGGTKFSFPGGFDLNSFALAVPQLRVGAVLGTEAILRYFSMNVGDTELGKVGLFGIGVQHSVSQHLGAAIPFDLSAGFFWQKLTLGENQNGDDLVSSSAFTIGVQASRRFVRVLVPYAGLSYDTHQMDLSYEKEADSEDEEDLAIDVNFDKTSTAHMTLGLMLNIPGMNMFIEYNISSQNSFAFGAGFGFGG